MPEPLSPAQLDAYLARIGYDGPLQVDAVTLAALHRAHGLAIPFENLDVQLGQPPTLDPAATFTKLVERRRGGWCYEQNGLLGRALGALGFTVTRLSGGVMRELRGPFTMGSHLCLKVRAEGRDWLCDAGFGASQLEPLPLTEASWKQGPIGGQLTRTADQYWRLDVQQGPNPLSYDFLDEPADEARLAALCTWQGSDPESVFVQNLVVQQRRDGAHLMLRGRVFTRTGAEGSKQRVLESAAELLDLLQDTFGLDESRIAERWDRICARHTLLFG